MKYEYIRYPGILYINTEKWFILSTLLKNSIKFLMVSILVGLNLDES